SYNSVAIKLVLRTKFFDGCAYAQKVGEIPSMEKLNDAYERSVTNDTTRPVDRRSFLKSGLLAGGAAEVGAGLLADGTSARAQERGRLNEGDAAILRFLAAAE